MCWLAFVHLVAMGIIIKREQNRSKKEKLAGEIQSDEGIRKEIGM